MTSTTRKAILLQRETPWNFDDYLSIDEEHSENTVRHGRIMTQKNMMH